MERKPEVRPRKHRIYSYSGPVIQLRITGLSHSKKNDINFSLSVNYRSDPYQCASVCWQAPLFIYGEEEFFPGRRIRCRSPPSILIFGSIKKSRSEDYYERN